MIQMNLSAFCLYYSGCFFPHLAGPKLGIRKIFYETRFHIFLVRKRALKQHLFKSVKNCFGDRKSLNSLLPPFRLDLIARKTPDFFRVVFKKSEVKFLAKSVNKKIF